MSQYPPQGILTSWIFENSPPPFQKSGYGPASLHNITVFRYYNIITLLHYIITQHYSSTTLQKHYSIMTLRHYDITKIFIWSQRFGFTFNKWILHRNWLTMVETTRFLCLIWWFEEPERKRFPLIIYMGQNLQDGKKVLWMSLIMPHSERHPVQTIHPTDLSLIPTWISIVWAPTQEFSPSWNARKRVQERVKFQEIPGNLYFQKTAENRLKSGKFKKLRPLLL